MGNKRKWPERTVHLTQAFGKYPFIFIVTMIMLSVVRINSLSLTLVTGALSVEIGYGWQTMLTALWLLLPQFAVEGPSARQPARIQSVILTTIYKTLHEHGIEIPFPQIDLQMCSSEEHQSIDFTGITDATRFKPVLQ